MITTPTKSPGIQKCLTLVPLLLLCVVLMSACKPADQPVPGSNSEATSRAVTDQPESGQALTDAGAEDTASQSNGLAALESTLGLKVLNEPWFGDLDGMIERRVVRVLTVYGLGRYYFQGAQEKGFAVETMKAFEESLNQNRKIEEKVYIVFFPVNREQLLPALLEGRGDIIAAGWTITPDRQEQVDFSSPVSKPVQEILVTGPSAEPLQSLDDLAGKTIHVRLSSSYFASLQSLNEKLVGAGQSPINIQPISELLEDGDLLEMVAGGLLPWVVVDDYKANIFKDVFPALVARPDLVVREGGRIAYAFRKNSPQFTAAINAHAKNHSAGTLHGNVLLNRYLRDFEWVENALHTTAYGRFEAVAQFFHQYGEQYGMDALLVAAQGYQESRLDQSARSHAGAIGIMQLLPTTAADKNVGIPDIGTEENNIHAGVKYLQFLRSRYFSDTAIDPLNQTLLAMAAYNAGPAKVAAMRKKAGEQGLDPNRWFGNVEVAAAQMVGSETVKYVANIYKYYVAYRMAAEQMNARSAERKLQGID